MQQQVEVSTKTAKMLSELTKAVQELTAAIKSLNKS
jgi:hypothetical protein